MANETKKTIKKEDKIKLNPLVWELAFNEDLIAQVIFVYKNNERKGTLKQKSRGEVSGGGKKPWKQKGTGRARHGSIRSPLWIGGGMTFAAIDKNFSRKINKKMAKKATCIMLSERLRKKELEFTKITEAQAKKLRTNEGKGILVVSESESAALVLRNNKGINVVNPAKLNAKHLVSSKKVLVDNDSVKILEKRLTNEK
jgi:large subunit ribosomal protein L4